MSTLKNSESQFKSTFSKNKIGKNDYHITCNKHEFFASYSTLKLFIATEIRHKT